MRRLASRTFIVALALAVGLTLALRAWPAASRDTGLAMRVEVGQGTRAALAAPVRVTLPTHHAINALAYVDRRASFRVTWDGWYYAPRDGRYSFVTRSDDGSWLWVGERLVVDNGGRHGVARRSGTVMLTEGWHPLRIGYEQHEGDWYFEARLREPGGTMRRLDAFARQLSGEPVTPAGTLRRVARAWLPVAAIWSWYAVYGLLLFGVGAWCYRRVEALSGVAPAGVGLAAVVAVWVLVALPGLEWGLPADAGGWAPDEVTPRGVASAVDARFSAPWRSLYPPLAFVLWTPLVLIMRGVGGIEGLSVDANPGAFHVHVAMRVVSVLMSAGTLASVYLVVRPWWGRAEALLASALAGVGVSFLYYAKTANVEAVYLYWLMLALAAFSGFVRTGRWPLVRWFALCGALAIVAKDQAAGYLVLVAPALAVSAHAHARRAGLDGRAAVRAVARRREWLEAVAIAAVVVGTAYLWSWANIAAHVEAARAGRYSPIVAATLRGHLALLGLHGGLLVFMTAPVVAVLAAAGLVAAARARQWGWLVVLVLPAVSNVALFLAAIRYTYDRFLLGVALLLACAAAPPAVALWRTSRWRTPIRVALALGAVVTLLHGITTNVLMRRDSRYVVEELLAERVDATHLVARLSPPQYMPRLDEQPSVDLAFSRADVEQWRPAVLLLNTTHVRRSIDRPVERALLDALESEALGFARLGTYRTPIPFWALAWHWPYFHRPGAQGFVNLDKINPEMDVWVSGDAGAATARQR